MEVPITQFRKNIFALTNQALEGRDVWFTHKGQRVKIVPEGKPVSKLSRVTPMEIIPPGVDLDDDFWKGEMMREWEQNWDHELSRVLKPQPRRAGPASAGERRRRRKA